MKRFLLLLAMIMLSAPTFAQAKGSSFPRKAAIPITVSMVTPAPLAARDDQRHGAVACTGVCHSRIFRRAKASFQ